MPYAGPAKKGVHEKLRAEAGLVVAQVLQEKAGIKKAKNRVINLEIPRDGIGSFEVVNRHMCPVCKVDELQAILGQRRCSW